MKVYLNSIKVNFKYIASHRFIWLILIVFDFIFYGFYQYASFPFDKSSWRHSFTIFMILSYISLPLLMYPLLCDTSRKVAENFLAIRLNVIKHYIIIAADYFMIHMFVFVFANILYVFIHSYTHRSEYDINRVMITIGFAALFLIFSHALFLFILIICKRFKTAYLIYIFMGSWLIILGCMTLLSYYIPIADIKYLFFDFVFDKRLILNAAHTLP